MTTIYSSADYSPGTRFPSLDDAGVQIFQDILGNVPGVGSGASSPILSCKHYVIKGSRFETPDATYTGFGSDGTYYVLGNPTAVSPNGGPTAHWAAEPAGPNRGTLDRFPDEILIVGTHREIVFLDASNFNLWLRFIRQDGVAIHPSAAVGNGCFLGAQANFGKIEFDTDSGVLYVATRHGLRVADFRRDRMAVLLSTNSVVTDQPTGAITAPPGATDGGSIVHRNVDDQLDAAKAWANVAHADWNLFTDEDEVLAIAVSPHRMVIPTGTDPLATVVLGQNRGMRAMASGLWRNDVAPPNNHNLVANGPGRLFISTGPETGIPATNPDGAILQGNAAGDSIPHAGGADTGVFLHSVGAAFVPNVFPGAGFRAQVHTGTTSAFSYVVSRETDTPIVGTDQLTLGVEVTTDTAAPTIGPSGFWEVLARVQHLWAHRDGSLGVVSGNRLIHSDTSNGNGQAVDTILNTSSSITQTVLPEDVTAIHTLFRSSNTYYLGTNTGLWSSELNTASGQLAPAVFLYSTATTPATWPSGIEPLYEILEHLDEHGSSTLGFPVTPSPNIRGVGVDPESGNTGVLQGTLCSLDGAVSPTAGTPETFTFGVGSDQLVLRIGYGDITHTFTHNTFTRDQIIFELETAYPGSRWTYLGAGQLRVETLVSFNMQVTASSAAALLGFAGAPGSPPLLDTGVFVEVDPGIHIVRASIQLGDIFTPTVTVAPSLEFNAAIGAAITPGSLEISETGGQAIVDNGNGGFVGDVDPLRSHTLDYSTGQIAVSFLAMPTGTISFRYTAARGVVHSVVGARVSAN